MFLAINVLCTQDFYACWYILPGNALIKPLNSNCTIVLIAFAEQCLFLWLKC